VVVVRFIMPSDTIIHYLFLVNKTCTKIKKKYNWNARWFNSKIRYQLLLHYNRLIQEIMSVCLSVCLSVCMPLSAWKQDYSVFRTNHVYPYTYMSTDTCCRIHVARSGYMLTVSRRHNKITIHLSHGRLVTLCIQQQTGDKLATVLLNDTRHNVDGNK